MLLLLFNTVALSKSFVFCISEMITPKDYFLSDLHAQLESVVACKPAELPNPRIGESTF